MAGRIGAGWMLEAGLVHLPELGPAVGTRVAETRVRADRLQQVERTEGVLRHLVPEAVVAAGPDEPHVAPLDLLGAQLHATVHVVEIVFVRMRERGGRASCGARFIRRLAGSRFRV